MNGQVKVSIYCAAFNHEKYIRDTLDSFLSQKCNFSIEALIHDDASSDSTAEIIREYENKSPIIRGICERENQYSQGKSILNLVIAKAKGEYIAFCEGDDYWSDENKLSIQAKYLDEHPEASGCCHAFSCLNEKGELKQFNNLLQSDGNITVRQFIMNEHMPQTSTLLIRKSVLDSCPDIFALDSTGDYPLRIWVALCGSFHYMNRNMSIYRTKSSNSWSSRISGNHEMLTRRRDKRIDFLTSLNQYTSAKYDALINNRIEYAKYDFFLRTGDYRKAGKSPLFRSESAAKRLYIKVRALFS